MSKQGEVWPVGITPVFRIEFMDIKPTGKSISDFKNKLEDLGIPVGAYKYLEAIQRQTIMCSGESGYKYQIESSDDSLRSKDLSPRSRANLLRNYVGRWEQKTGLEYGFNHIAITEIETHGDVIIQYQDAINNLKSVFESHSEVVDTRLADSLILELHERLKDRLKINGRPIGKYFEPGTMTLKIDNFDYFSRSLGFSFGIYGPYFDILASTDGSDKTNFYRFMAAKLNFENQHTPQLAGIFNAKKVGDRIKKSQKGYSHLGEQPFLLNLIDNEFVKYISDHRNIR